VVDAPSRLTVAPGMTAIVTTAADANLERDVY
jgi:hypothetical protein